MSDSEDEFDQANQSLDVDHLPYITDLPASQDDSPIRPEEQPNPLQSTEADIDPILYVDPKVGGSPRSEYSAYDLSEFTTEELQALETAALKGEGSSSRSSKGYRNPAFSEDPPLHPVPPRVASPAAVATEQAEKQSDITEPEGTTHPRCSTLTNTLSNGGPAIDIELEQSTSSPSIVRNLFGPLLGERPNADGKRKAGSGETDAEESADSAANGRNVTSKGKERAVEDPEVIEVKIESRKPKVKSWRKRMKKGAWFRVTDFTGPTWCEVQFGYQHLHEEQVKEDKKEQKEARHEIVTPTGKTVKVDNQTVQRQARIKQTGTSVHRVLELEVHPEEEKKPVQIETKEDRLGIYFVQMINSVQSLIENGVCREMVVLGLVHDELVRGIIDEVVREPLPTPSFSPSENERKRSRGETSLPSTPTKPRKPPKVFKDQSPSQTPITSFFPVSPTPKPWKPFTPITEPHFRLKISDTKTRMYPYIPPYQDTTSGRLQLMIYHRLLSSLLAPKSSPLATDFASMWKKAGLSPTAKFSPKFHEDTELPGEVTCLEDLVGMWYNSAEMLSARSVDPELTIEWRTVDRDSSSRQSKAEEVAIPEETVVADVAGSASVKAEVPLQTPEATAIAQDDIAEVVMETGAQNTGGGAATATVLVKETNGKGAETSEDLHRHRSIVIGTTTFLQEDDVLDRHLSDILELWNGKRQPRGVDIELTRRCNSCAFKDGCEWREQKSGEILKQAQGVLSNDPFANSVPGLGLPSYADRPASGLACSTPTL